MINWRALLLVGQIGEAEVGAMMESQRKWEL